MKRALVLAVALLGISTLCSGQMIDASKVPQTVRITFDKRYPRLVPQWKKEDGKYGAEYKLGGKTYEILFDRLGNSEQEIGSAQLPAKIISFLKGRYKGAAIEKVSMLQTAQGAVTYRCFIENKSLLFSAEGKYLGEKAAG